MRFLSGIIFFVWGFFLCYGPQNAYAVKSRILVLLPQRGEPYLFVAQRIKKAFPESRILTIPELLKMGTTYQQPVVVCLGTKTLKWALKRPWQGKVVFSLVLDVDDEIENSLIAKQGRLYGVRLFFPPERYFFWLKRLFPYVKRVGFLSTTRTKKWIPEFLSAGQQFSFQVYPFPILEGSKNKLEETLRKISTRVKALIVLPDPFLVNYYTFPKLVFFSIEQEIILITISEKLAKAGALLSLGWDFSSIADQTIFIIRSLLNNNYSGPHYLYPQREKIYINLRVLKALNLKVPAPFYDQIIFVGEGAKDVSF